MKKIELFSIQAQLQKYSYLKIKKKVLIRSNLFMFSFSKGFNSFDALQKPSNYGQIYIYTYQKVKSLNKDQNRA
jgi:hypothetical protein